MSDTRLILEVMPLVANRWLIEFTVDGERIHPSELLEPDGTLPLMMAAAIATEVSIGTDFLAQVSFSRDHKALFGWRVTMDDGAINPIALGLYLMNGLKLMEQMPGVATKDAIYTKVDLAVASRYIHMDAVAAYQEERHDASASTHGVMP